MSNELKARIENMNKYSAINNFDYTFKKANTSKPYAISIVVTNECNLRCSYCCYSESFNYTHDYIRSNDEFNYERFLHFVSQNYKKNDRVTIGFYGGEPLLRFDAIMKIVYELNKLESDFTYTMTTNGVLLEDTEINFCIKNNFMLVVSIDGPKEIHDKKRKTINGHGTWNKVMENFKRIKSINTEYFNDNVSINSVVDTTEEWIKVKQWLQKNSYAGRINFRSKPHQEEIQYNPWGSEPVDMDKLIENIDSFIELLEAKSYDNIESDSVKMLKLIHARSEKAFGMALCDPGNSKFLMDTNGDLYSCDKFDFAYKLGHINSGIDPVKSSELKSDFKTIVDNNCVKCWAYSLCSPCYAHFATPDKLELNRNYCLNKKYKLLLMLKVYTRLIEKHSLDSVSELIMSYS